MTTPNQAQDQKAFEERREAIQQAHLATCNEAGCRSCKIIRGESVQPEPTPRCPHCNAYGYMGPVSP